MVKHEKSLYNLVLKKTGCPEDAEDLVQDVYLMALVNINNGIVIDNLKSYLMQVMVNLIGKSIGKIKNLEKTYADYQVEQEIEFQIQQNLEIDSLIKSCNESVVKKIVNNLPDKYREVIDKFYYKQKKVKKIAEELEIGESNVKKRLMLSRELIKEGVRKFDDLK